MDNIVQKLQQLKKGEKLIYHTGLNLTECRDAGHEARKLYDAGKVTLVRKRIEDPLSGRIVDRKSGTGSFAYIAIGL